jgi:hypothetical protein
MTTDSNPPAAPAVAADTSRKRINNGPAITPENYETFRYWRRLGASAGVLLDRLIEFARSHDFDPALNQVVPVAPPADEKSPPPGKPGKRR